MHICNGQTCWTLRQSVTQSVNYFYGMSCVLIPGHYHIWWPDTCLYPAIRPSMHFQRLCRLSTIVTAGWPFYIIYMIANGLGGEWTEGDTQTVVLTSCNLQLFKCLQINTPDISECIADILLSNYWILCIAILIIVWTYYFWCG